MSQLLRTAILTLAAAVSFLAALVLVFYATRTIPSINQVAQVVLTRSGLQTAAPAPVLAPTATGQRASEISAGDPRPLIPARMVAIAGEPLAIYFDNLVLVKDIDSVRIDIQAGDLEAHNERRRWVLTPRLEDVGQHPMRVVVRDWANQTLATAEATLEVIPPLQIRSEKNLLLVGDSLTHQNIYPNALHSLLELAAPGRVTFVGTHAPEPSLPIDRDPQAGVRHEGYGGWSWELFASHYLPGKEELYKRTSSPFVFADSGQPQIDVQRYLKERAKVDRLDVAIFMLGLNETFAANPDDPAALENVLSTTSASADKVIAAFRKGAPDAQLLIAIPAPFTRSDVTFRFKYAEIKPEFGNAWRHRRIQHAYARHLMEHFEKAAIPNVIVVPSHLAIDIVDGYWIDDAGHPNEIGGLQLARAIYPYLSRALTVKAQ